MSEQQQEQVYQLRESEPAFHIADVGKVYQMPEAAILHFINQCTLQVSKAGADPLFSLTDAVLAGLFFRLHRGLGFSVNKAKLVCDELRRSRLPDGNYLLHYYYSKVMETERLGQPVITSLCMAFDESGGMIQPGSAELGDLLREGSVVLVNSNSLIIPMLNRASEMLGVPHDTDVVLIMDGGE